MTNGGRFILALVAIVELAAIGCNVPSTTAPQVAAKPFTVAHALTYKDPNGGGVAAVDLSSSGVLKAQIIYESQLLPARDQDGLCPPAQLRQIAATLEKSPVPVVIDIERWKVSFRHTSEREERVRKLTRVIKTMRELRPDLQFGFYGIIPERDYWVLVDPSRGSDKNLWHENNAQAFKDLAPSVDAVFPSLYTFYPDLDGWWTFADEMLQTSISFRKPVYCFIMPRYHPSSRDNGQMLNPQYWRLQLDTCRQFADGIVIWDYSPDKEWDANAPWWMETQAFMAGLHNQADSAPINQP
jgi:hypothetical protein